MPAEECTLIETNPATTQPRRPAELSQYDNKTANHVERAVNRQLGVRAM